MLYNNLPIHLPFHVRILSLKPLENSIMTYSVKTRVFALVLIVTASLAWTAVGECQFTARLFTTGSHTTIHLSAAQWCVIAEPENNSFQITNIDANTVYLWSNTYPITGDVDRIYPTNKTLVVGDRDGNGIQDVQFCFSNADINALFSRLHGHQPKTVHLGLTGNLVSGGWFSGNITIDVYPKD